MAGVAGGYHVGIEAERLDTALGKHVLSLFEDVRIIVAGQLDQPPESLDPETDLVEAGLASLDMVELIFLVEDKFDVSLPDLKTTPIRTIGDIVTILQGLGVDGAPA